MDARQLLRYYNIEPFHLEQNRMTIVEIARFDSEQIEHGNQAGEWKHKLYFTGWRLPLKLNNTRINILMAMFGQNTDAWVGRRIGLFVGVANHYGKSEPCVMIHLQPPPDGTPLTDLPAGHPCRGSLPPGHPAAAMASALGPRNVPAASPPVSAHRDAPVRPESATSQGSFDTRKLGQRNAANFSSALAEQGATLASFVAWCRVHDRALHDMLWDKEVEDWPRGATPVMQRYLREMPADHAASAPSDQSRTAVAAGLEPRTEIPATAGDDDIPF
ncbi:MAG: hypothetical protein ACK4WH_00820 [Phycisphaerales bacterium]